MRFIGGISFRVNRSWMQRVHGFKIASAAQKAQYCTPGRTVLLVQVRVVDRFLSRLSTFKLCFKGSPRTGESGGSGF